MDLFLGQLVYTSFPGMGFRTLASAQVPMESQQAFIEHVVSQHWDSYHPPKSEYRAVYLYQSTLEWSLFGWLYNDGLDDMGRSHVPYFICYYLAEPLHAFQLENIFNCLQQGPVALIDRHSLPATLETIVLPDLWSYQPVRPGVAIPSGVRRRSQIALKRGELLKLFVPVEEQEKLIKLNGQSYEQQIANLSIYTRYIIEGIGTGAAVITEPIAARTAQQTKATQSLTKVGGAIKIKDARTIKALNKTVTLNTTDTRLLTRTIDPQILSTRPNSHQNLERRAHHNFLLAYRKSQLLLGAGITATILALVGSMYGLLQMSIFTQSNPDLISSASNPVLYQTLAEVPNVPQGLFNYGGATTFAPLRSKAVVSAINLAHPKFQLYFIEAMGGKPGSGSGIKMLLAGELSFAQSSRPLKDTEFSKAKERGFTLEQVPVAIEGIAFYVNPLVSIPGLSLSQVGDIFTGKITNWKALGGPDLPITPFSPNVQVSGTADVLKEKVLAGKEFSPSVQEVETTTESIRKVAKTPGGIGYATASVVIGQKTINPLPLSNIHLLPLSTGAGQVFVSPTSGANDIGGVNRAAFANGSYPLTRRIFVIIKRDGRLDEQAGSAYTNLLLSNEGQRLVEQAGFVPIRSH